MSILIDNASRVLVQGITGREGAFHSARMLAAGTNIVAGVTPGHDGETVHGVPVYGGVHAAMADVGFDVAVLFVPAARARDALFEAADAGARLIVCITEGIPVRDMTEVTAHLSRRGARLVGPNCPGLITPARCSAGIMPSEIFMPGSAGVVSRSGTLTYEVVHELTRAGVGQSTAVGMGGDAVHGIGFIECLELFEADHETEGVALIGEIGGDDEERAAAYVREHMTKPVVAYVAGHSAPPGRRMGHAGAIVEGTSGTAATKKAALEAAGIPVASSPSELARLLGEAIRRRRTT
jgi:succinyl-CoA synthetase alpha subunit